MRFRSYNKGGPLHYSALLRNYPAIFLVPLLPPSPPISLSVLCLRFPPCWLSSVKLCICVKKARELIFWRAGRSLSPPLFPFFSFPIRISQIGRFPNSLATWKRINPPKHLCSRRSVAYTCLESIFYVRYYMLPARDVWVA